MLSNDSNSHINSFNKLKNSKFRRVSIIKDNIICVVCCLEENSNTQERRESGKNCITKGIGLHAPSIIDLNSLSQSPLPLIQTNNNYLVYPCLCSHAFHVNCLIKYSIKNFNFFCEKCRIHYPLDFGKNNAENTNKNYILFLISIYFCIHIILFTLSILFFLDSFNFDIKIKIWTYVLGFLFFILNIFILTFTINHIKIVNKKNTTTPILTYQSKIIGKFELDEIKIDKFYEFLKYQYDCDKIGLIEKKINKLNDYERLKNNQNKINQLINKEEWAKVEKKFALADISMDLNYMNIMETNANEIKLFDLNSSNESILIMNTSIISQNNRSFNRSIVGTSRLTNHRLLKNRNDSEAYKNSVRSSIKKKLQPKMSLVVNQSEEHELMNYSISRANKMNEYSKGDSSSNNSNNYMKKKGHVKFIKSNTLSPIKSVSSKKVPKIKLEFNNNANDKEKSILVLKENLQKVDDSKNKCDISIIENKLDQQDKIAINIDKSFSLNDESIIDFDICLK